MRSRDARSRRPLDRRSSARHPRSIATDRRGSERELPRALLVRGPDQHALLLAAAIHRRGHDDRALVAAIALDARDLDELELQIVAVVLEELGALAALGGGHERAD